MRSAIENAAAAAAAEVPVDFVWLFSLVMTTSMLPVLRPPMTVTPPKSYVKHHFLAIYLSKWHEVLNSCYIFIAWERSRSTATHLHYLVWRARAILNLIFQCWFQKIPQYFTTLPHALTNIYVICTVKINLGRLTEISFFNTICIDYSAK